MRGPDKKKKKKGRGKNSKTTPPPSSDALSDDIRDPKKAARVDWVTDMYGSMMSRIQIVNRLMAGRPANPEQGITEIKGISNAEAYRYFDLAVRLAAKEIARDRREAKAWHRAQLFNLSRMARAQRQPAVAMSILERVARFDGVTADEEQETEAERPSDEMTDSEIIAAIKAEEDKLKKDKP